MCPHLFYPSQIATLIKSSRRTQEDRDHRITQDLQNAELRSEIDVLEIEKNRTLKQVTEGTILLDEASALYEAKKSQEEKIRLENIEALEARISQETEKLEKLKTDRKFMNDRFNELVGKQSEAESKVQIISAKIDEHKEVLKATRKEIKDYPALDPNDIDEEALRFI